MRTSLKKILQSVSKTIVLLTLTGIMFSPLQGIFFSPTIAQAAITSSSQLSTKCLTNQGCTAEENAFLDSQGGPAAAQAAREAAAKTLAGNGAGNYTQDGLSCSFYDIASCLTNIIYVFTVGLGSGMAYVGGFVFDMTVSLSLNSAAYALDFLSVGWTTARDLANMGFILILVYIAFMIMFQAENRGTIQTLAWVIFIALIINFSFFLTRVVIDAGNILAVQFYNAIDAPTMAGTFSTTNATTGTLANAATGIATKLTPNGVFENTKDLTAGIMQALNIQELFNDASFKNFAKQSGFGTKFIILSFLYIAIGACYFILAAMFLAVGVKFLARIVVLWFLIIAAPLAFIARALPTSTPGPSWYEQWQRELVKHTFYPAIFLFIFLFINIVMTGLRGPTGILGGLATDLNALNANADLGSFVIIASSVANVGIRLGFIIAMLYIALKASERVGVHGAAMAQKVTSFAFGQTGRLASAPVGWMGRRTIGWAGAKVADSDLLKRRTSASAPALSRGFWKDVGRGATTLGKASYDPRNAPGTSVLKSGVEKITGSTVSAGTPATGGIAAQIKERNDERKAAEKEEKQKAREEGNLKAIKELAENSTKHDALEAKEKTTSLTSTEQTHKTALKHKIGQIETKINGLNKSEMESFKSADIQKVLKHLNKEAIKKINESEKYTEKEKEDIRTEHDLKMREKVGEKAIAASHGIIEELRDLRGLLMTNASMPSHFLKKLEHATTTGNNLNVVAIREMERELKTQKGVAEGAQFANVTQDIKDKAKYAIGKLDTALNQIKELKKHIDEVPETIGDTPNSKEFKIAA